jgi:hypothetical protein
LVYTIEMIKNNKEEFDICFICNFLKLPWKQLSKKQWWKQFVAKY